MVSYILKQNDISAACLDTEGLMDQRRAVEDDGCDFGLSAGFWVETTRLSES